MNKKYRRLFKKKRLWLIFLFLFIFTGLNIYNIYVENSICQEEKDLKQDNQLFFEYDHPGNPPAILLLHGYGGSPLDMMPLIEVLKTKGYAFRMITLPGHGSSPKDLKKTKTQDWLKKVYSSYDELKKKYSKVSLIGFSMGGALAATIAAEKEISKLVLISPYFQVRKQWFYVLSPSTWSSLISKTVPFVKKLKIGQINNPNGLKKYNAYKHIPSTIEELQKIGNLAREKSKSINCDTLWIHSAGDKVADFKISHEMFQEIPAKHKFFIKYTRSNHIILYDYDGPDAIKKIISFLETTRHK